MISLWRHKKRGSTYTVVGTAEVQSSNPVNEGDRLVVYRGEDGRLWARPVDEFTDGRFELVHAPVTDAAVYKAIADNYAQTLQTVT